MTVAELIVLLKTHPADAVILVDDDGRSHPALVVEPHKFTADGIVSEVLIA